MAAWNDPRGPRVHPRNGHLPSEFEHVSTIVVRFPSNPTEGVEVPCFAQSPNLGASTMAMATQHSEKCISSIMPTKCPSDPDLSLSLPALSPAAIHLFSLTLTNPSPPGKMTYLILTFWIGQSAAKTKMKFPRCHRCPNPSCLGLVLTKVASI